MTDTVRPYNSGEDAAALRQALATGEAAYADPDVVSGIIDRVSTDPAGIADVFGLKVSKKDVPALAEPFRQTLDSAYTACLVRAASPIPVMQEAARRDAMRMIETAQLVAERTGVPESAYAEAIDALIAGDPSGFDALMGEFYR